VNNTSTARAVEAVLPLNVRIPAALSREFGLLTARLGVTKQAAVAQALRLWITQQTYPNRTRREAPLISSDRTGSIDLTNEQIDDILFS
jgi:hypothetical protein